MLENGEFLLVCDFPFPIFENIHQRPIKEGVKKEDLKVQVEDDNVLQISGEKVKEKEEKNDKWHHLQRQCGGFIRRFWLPENAKMDAISCKMAEGVLTVTITKKEAPPQNKNLRAINVD